MRIADDDAYRCKMIGIERISGRPPQGLYPKKFGVIAQLGERFNGIEEVGGSIPPGSTTYSHDFLATLALFKPLPLFNGLCDNRASLAHYFEVSERLKALLSVLSLAPKFAFPNFIWMDKASSKEAMHLPQFSINSSKL